MLRQCGGRRNDRQVKRLPTSIYRQPREWTRGLELHAEGELQLSHGNVRVDVGDDTAGGAVYAACAGGVWYIEGGMVEDVEGLKLELTSYALLYRAVLQEDRVRHVLTRTGEGVAANVAEGCECGAPEWTGISADGSGRRREVLD